MATDGGGTVRTASDFFGANDPDGIEKFKTVALRALHDQKMEEELKVTKADRERLYQENQELTKQIRQIKASMETNIEDRERVLAFKSKRIEELLIKVQEYEAVNGSLLLTINGGSHELSDAGRNTRTSLTLLERGLPLFHPVETCKEQEFKRLWEEKKQQCEDLQREIAENQALVEEMRRFQQERSDWIARIELLETTVASVTAERDEKVGVLERKIVMEHDRLLREKEAELLAREETMTQQMRTQLDVTTQRTIEENTRVQLELRYQSAQVEKMVAHMDKLTLESRQVVQEKQLVEEMNQVLSKKVKFYESLFAKMQQKDQLRSKQQHQTPMPPSLGSSRSDSREENEPRRRKAPLPSLALSSGAMARSAFSLCSPPASPGRGGLEDDGDDEALGPLELDSIGQQLNTAASALESHLNKREFVRKQVQALVSYHQNSPGRGIDGNGRPRPKIKKILLAKGEYSPAKFTPRGARRLREAPLTLEAFINENTPRSPVRTEGDDASRRLPAISPHRPSDASELWRPTRPPQKTIETGMMMDSIQHMHTARF
ncbi:hypothetical protein Poli38472_007742 [Pythium oligandrum]|uniref:Cilia- and flagella-associated protein 157 n=1 Tax=Pythium oligandrum TaxID=41045 RepID=A0A8K1FLB5_PYTOL|nr:hypothetical protein Poli38472_007742 [Pythium oligandrum]|eukprot:TMW68070.1 hypothetical protein Poli38472_007742 [Pythium oligandrum]